MSDPLHYREPGTEEPSSPQDQRARSTCTIGITVMFVSIVLMCVPVLLPLGSGSKYLIATAFVGAAVGFSIALNSAVDWWRGR